MRVFTAARCAVSGRGTETEAFSMLLCKAGSDENAPKRVRLPHENQDVDVGSRPAQRGSIVFFNSLLEDMRERRTRPREQEPLADRDADLFQGLKFLLRLDAFGDHHGLHLR